MENTAKQTAQLQLTEARREIGKAYDDACEQAERKGLLQSLQSRKLLSILLLRQKEALELLDHVETVVDGRITPATPRSPLYAFAWSRLINHPVLRTVLYSMLTLCCALSLLRGGMNILALLLAVLLLAVEIIKLCTPRAEGSEQPEYITHLHMNRSAKDSFSGHMSSGLIHDMQDIMNLFNGQTVEMSGKAEADMAEMYQTIYSTADAAEEALKPVLDRQEQMLWSIGLEVVPFTDGAAGCFDINDEDCPSQMIYPAIRRRKDQQVVRKGLYIRQTEG